MPATTLDSEKLVELLQSGYVILTPNHRTAVQAHEACGKVFKSTTALRVAPSPTIHPIDIWLQERLQSLIELDPDCEPLTVLDSRQELALWKSLIRDSSVKNPLLNLQNAAAQVLEAYRLCLQWQISLDEFRPFQSRHSDHVDDCSAFLEWAKLYQQRCRQQGLISFAELLSRYYDKLDKTAAGLPDRIIALGFSEPPPLYQNLFRHLESQCQFEFRQWQQHKPLVKKVSYASSADEIKASAQWSKQILQDTPQAHIGIICNELQQELSTLKRLFRDTYESQAAFRKACFIQSDVSVCQDIPALQQFPHLLKFNLTDLPCLDACYLLRSPLLLAAKEESPARAAMELRLRDRAESVIRNSDLRFQLGQEDRPWHSPRLHQALQDCENLQRRQQKFQTLTQWSELFDQQLGLLLWSQQEADHQASLLRTYCSLAFKQLRQLDFIAGSISIHEALSQFEQALLSLSSKEHRQEAPVQILHAQDAEGLQFTHLWFMGLSDTQWPPRQHGNPFIPYPLQKQYALPNSTAQLTFQSAHDNIKGMLNNTRVELMLSYPRNSEFGEQSASALLRELGTGEEITVMESSDHATLLQKDSIQCYRAAQEEGTLESFSENTLLALHADEDPHGGVALIQDQAECPFRAFALHRLAAKELPAVYYGIPAKDLGSMLHRVLERLWQQLISSSNLQNLKADQQDSIIMDAVDTGLSYLTNKHPQLMRPHYVELEKQRLSKLITRWLDIEKQRASFTVIAHETEVHWKHKGLSLKFRIDRIDESNNGHVLIDYKSGSKNSVNWDDERPSAPQLLLYNEALAQEGQYQPVKALLYAQVNIDDLQYRGISADADTYPKTSIKDQKKLPDEFSWQQLQQYWQQSLQNMADEFLAGYVAVQPKSPTSCQYCHLDAFCRIQEKLGDEEEQAEVSDG